MNQPNAYIRVAFRRHGIVAAGPPDETTTHDEPDLCVDVVVEMPQDQPEEGAEYTERNHEQDGDRHALLSGLPLFPYMLTNTPPACVELDSHLRELLRAHRRAVFGN